MCSRVTASVTLTTCCSTTALMTSNNGVKDVDTPGVLTNISTPGVRGKELMLY